MLRGYLSCLIGCFAGACFLQAQMAPSNPVLDFSLPRFGENGYVQWILRGGKGIYDSDEQIRVEEMSLSVYSGDEHRTLEMTINSPAATFLVKENRAVSDSSIEITGANFKVCGTGWTWDGARKEIEVKREVAVEFSQEVVRMLSGKNPEKSDDARSTEISSRSLLLRTTPETYRFQFADSVRVVSGDSRLNSEMLLAIADVPQGKESGDASVADLELDSIDRIIATGQVVITQAGNVLKAREALFSLREESSEFKGNPSIKTAGAQLSGHFIRSERGKLVVNGSEGSGRAQMTVYQSGGLGVSKGVSLDQETVVFADSIKMQELETENQFNFEGSTEVVSGSMLLRTDHLTLYLDPAMDGEVVDGGSVMVEGAAGAGAAFRLGELVRVTGEGSVHIEQEGQTATCDRVVFYPKEEHAVLSGNPKVDHEQAIITGDTMELKRGFAVVRSLDDQLAQVVLPKLPDLGAGNLQLMDGLQLSEPEETAIEETEIVESETIVRAKTLLATEMSDHYSINFTDTVSVEGTNLKALCDRMEVILVEQKDRSDREAQMEVQAINAYENITFVQSGRTATADKAMIRPVEGEIVLEGNAELTDIQGKVAGHRITLHKGKGRATVEGDGTDGSRARLTLPEMELPEIDF